MIDILKEAEDEFKGRHPIRFQHEQLVHAAIEFMETHGYKVLPVYEYNKYIGTIHLKTLIGFVHGNPDDPLRCHKLNFDLYTALYILNKKPEKI